MPSRKIERLNTRNIQALCPFLPRLSISKKGGLCCVIIAALRLRVHLAT
jgi:hypothetical protein